MNDLQNAKILDMYDRLFAEEGWKELMKDLTERNDMYMRQLIHNPSGEKDLYYVKGYIAANQYLTTLESSLETAKQAGMLEPSESLPEV
jgi:hypothetical protein